MSSTAKAKSSRSDSILSASAHVLPAAVLSAVYLAAWFTYVQQGPLGAIITAPERVILDQALHSDSLGGSLYILILRLTAFVFSEEGQLIVFARVLNVVALLTTTWVIAKASAQVWRSGLATWISGLLVGMNPILVFWSTTINPALLAMLFTALAFAPLQTWLKEPSLTKTLSIGVFLGLAALFESALVYLIIPWLITAFLHPRREQTSHFLAAVSGPVAVFAIVIVTPLQMFGNWSFEPANIPQGLYIFFSSYELFDGKNYELHNQIHKFLLVNPIHWGLLFLIGAAGFFLRYKMINDCPRIRYGGIALACFAIGFALSEGASQMRAVAYPGFAFFGGALILLPTVWEKGDKATKRQFKIGLGLLAVLLYSSHLLAQQNRQNWLVDYVHLAEAHLEKSTSELASKWASKALGIAPDNSEMKRIPVIASFEDWALLADHRGLTIEDCEALLRQAKTIEAQDPDFRAIRALYHYKLRDQETALKEWRAVAQQSALAYLFLYWTENAPAPDQNVLDQFAANESRYADLLEQAIQIDRDRVTRTRNQRILDNVLAAAF